MSLLYAVLQAIILIWTLLLFFAAGPLVVASFDAEAARFLADALYAETCEFAGLITVLKSGL